MHSPALPLLAIMALTGCDRPGRPELMFAMRVRPQCPTRGENAFYPDGAFDRGIQSASGIRFTAELGSRILAAMHEPPLSCGPLGESYRFLWIHSFSASSRYPPTIVRITRAGDGWMARAVRSVNAVDLREAERREVRLTDEESQQLLASVADFGVWRRSAFAYNPDVSDGESWIVEARRGTAYHVVALINVDRAAVRKLPLSFLKAAGMAPGPLLDLGAFCSLARGSDAATRLTSDTYYGVARHTAARGKPKGSHSLC
jgi:hypothetical protein